jgi:hypothetical protein
MLSITMEIDEKINNMPETLITALSKLKPADLQLAVGSKKPFSVRNLFETFRDRNINVDGKTLVDTKNELIETRIVEGTFSWLEEEPRYTSWLHGQPSPFLYVSGSPGAGKTYFTSQCHRQIREFFKRGTTTGESDKPHQSTSAACFFFEPGREDSQDFQDVLASLILQIAEQDNKLCESMAKESDKFSKAKEEEIVTCLWDNFILKRFEKASEGSRVLYILLDGIEQAKEENWQKMLECFQALGSDKHSIRVMLTGPPNIRTKVDLKSLSTIDLDQQTKSAGDISKVIEHRIKNSNDLKMLGPASLTKIKDKFSSWTRSESFVNYPSVPIPCERVLTRRLKVLCRRWTLC